MRTKNTDGVLQPSPGLAARRLPWGKRPRRINPNGVGPVAHDGTQPRWGWHHLFSGSQGRRSCVAPTLGWDTERLWRSDRRPMCMTGSKPRSPTTRLFTESARQTHAAPASSVRFSLAGRRNAGFHRRMWFSAFPPVRGVCALPSLQEGFKIEALLLLLQQ